MDKKWIAVVAGVIGIAAGAVAGPAVMAAVSGPAESSAETGVADRVAIEDLVVRYYSHLGGTSGEVFGQYFTDDGVFEVNGAVYNGRQEIVDLYNSMGGGVAEGPESMFHMMLTNAVIDVDGDTARASFLWTGVVNPADATKAPIIREQGREYDLLVKQDGRWLIQKRVVIADSGLPPSMSDTWERAADFSLDAN